MSETHVLHSQPIAASIEEIDSDEEITEFSNAQDDSKVEIRQCVAECAI